ncbi:MAG: helix-turn-helix transcriptional regulator [Eubacterium sp.]|nr:helix-turn-helix transcriptional regulator [Eubacterium sp.]
MISSDVIRGYNDTIILYLLREDPSYGYEISHRIRLLSEDKYVIKETTLYSAFTRMEKNGYVESFSQTGDNGKRRTYYRITDEGKRYYDEKCREWALTKDVIDRFVVLNDDKVDARIPVTRMKEKEPVPISAENA